jgi:hypothetical protein
MQNVGESGAIADAFARRVGSLQFRLRPFVEFLLTIRPR